MDSMCSLKEPSNDTLYRQIHPFFSKETNLMYLLVVKGTAKATNRTHFFMISHLRQGYGAQAL